MPMTLNKVSPSPWVDSVQPWIYTLGSGSMPASLGTSWYVLVTYTFKTGSRPIPRQPRCPLRMGEDDPGEVGGVLTLLEVEGELLVVPGASTWKSDGNKPWESLSCACSGRIWTGPRDDRSPQMKCFPSSDRRNNWSQEVLSYPVAQMTTSYLSWLTCFVRPFWNVRRKTSLPLSAKALVDAWMRSTAIREE